MSGITRIMRLEIDATDDVCAGDAIAAEVKSRMLKSLDADLHEHLEVTTEMDYDDNVWVLEVHLPYHLWQTPADIAAAFALAATGYQME